MSKKSFVFFSLLIVSVVIVLSLVVWYLIKPEIQFIIYWLVGIIVVVIFVTAGIVQISGYSARDLLHIKNPIHERTRKALVSETNNSKRILEPKLRGIPFILQRDETKQIIEQIHLGNPVLFTGEAGTGKSGIAVALVLESENLNIFPLLIDARRLMAYNNAAEMRSHFDIEEPLIEVIERIAEDTGIWIILDQLDNIAGSRCCNVIINILVECSKMLGASVIVMSRHREGNEREALRPLLEADFTKITCSPLPEDQILEVLRHKGVFNPTKSVIDLAKNPLNLDLICEIMNTSGSNVIDDIGNNTDLWESYREALRDRESISGDDQGELIIIEAIRLAQDGLNNIDRTFRLEYKKSKEQQRLASNGVIEPIIEHGLWYQFSHEKLQDYLYAWHACNMQYRINQVYDEIDSIHARNIIVWMADIYEQRNAPEHHQFVEELLLG